MGKPKVFFRADGNAKMGLGHIVRSLALADMLKAVFECYFIIREPLPTLRKQILETCEAIIELPDTDQHETEAKQIAQDYLKGDEIVVLDGYHFRTDYQKTIKDKGCQLVCIDDIHAYPFVADVIINHAGGIEKTAYSAEAYTQFCLGLKYALLRKPFQEAAKNKNHPGRDDSIFICLGGADPKNDTLGVLQLCEKVSKIQKCYLVIGGAYQHRKALDNYLANTTLEIEVLSNLSAEEMVVYMKKCNRAITSPSTISYEYLSVGGELYLKPIADNQLNIYQYFTSAGLAFSIDVFPVEEQGRIDDLLQAQVQLLDGNTQASFLELFKQLSI